MKEQLETCCGSPAYAAPELVSGKSYIGSEVRSFYESKTSRFVVERHSVVCVNILLPSSKNTSGLLSRKL